MSLTIGQQLALEVLRGNDEAAQILADKLIEERDHVPSNKMPAAIVGDGYLVYHWPEFRALMLRLGVDWHLRTRRIQMTIGEGEAVVVVHEHLATDENRRTQT